MELNWILNKYEANLLTFHYNQTRHSWYQTSRNIFRFPYANLFTTSWRKLNKRDLHKGFQFPISFKLKENGSIPKISGLQTLNTSKCYLQRIQNIVKLLRKVMPSIYLFRKTEFGESWEHIRTKFWADTNNRENF